MSSAPPNGTQSCNQSDGEPHKIRKEPEQWLKRPTSPPSCERRRSWVFDKTLRVHKQLISDEGWGCWTQLFNHLSASDQSRIRLDSNWSKSEATAATAAKGLPSATRSSHAVIPLLPSHVLAALQQWPSAGKKTESKKTQLTHAIHTFPYFSYVYVFFCLQVPYFEHSSTPYLDKGVTGAVKMMASLSHGRLGRLDGKLHLEWPSNYCAGACELHSHVLKRKSMNKAQRTQRLFFSGPHHTTAKRMTGIRPYLSQALIGIFQLRWIGNNPNSGHGPKQLISSKNVRIHEGICSYMQLLIFICFVCINIIYTFNPSFSLISGIRKLLYMTRTGPNMTSDADPVADPRSSALATAEACSASPAYPPKLNRYVQNVNNPHIAHIQLFVVAFNMFSIFFTCNFRG